MFTNGIESISLKAAERIAATNTSAAVDISNYTGEALLVLNASVTEAADNSCAVKLTHCDTSGGSYTDTGITFTSLEDDSAAAVTHQVQRISVDGLKKYVKVVGTLTGTTPKVTYSVELIAKKQQ